MMRKILLLFLLLNQCYCLLAQNGTKISVNARRIIEDNKNKEEVFFLVASSFAQLHKELKQLGDINIIRTDERLNLLVVRAYAAKIKKLVSENDAILFVDVNRKAREELAITSFDNTVNALHKSHVNFPGINGEQIVVSVKENRLDTFDIDFKGRFLKTGLESSILSTHASTMATLIGGAGNTYFTAKGAATKVTLSSASFATLLPEPDSIYRKYRISLQNHSYGTGIENYYGIDAAAYDLSVKEQPSLLHVFSAGNSGNLSPADGRYAGLNSWANLTGSFKMSKNSISVGAVDSFYRVPPLSSRGPAHDGRLKPELVAFGEDGSSGAAAIVSGISSLIQQAYSKNHHDSLPSAALTKAILINSADEIGEPGPDFQSGFGNANAYRALQTVYLGNYATDTVSQGNAKEFIVNVPANSRSLKITLCWNELPAMVNTSRALLNDLDLTLIRSSDQESWLPWVLNSFPHADSLKLPAQRKRDTLNTVEQISLTNPFAGEYRVRINAISIDDLAPVNFSIAYQVDSIQEFLWQYPLSTSKLQSGTNTLLRFEAAAANGSLDYSIDKGKNWQEISGSVDLTRTNFYWQTPDTNVTALLRMRINSKEYISDSFIISTAPVIKVGFNCEDSLLLFWNKEKVSSYQVYQLGNEIMEPLVKVNDSFVVLSKDALSSFHFAVAPIIDAGKTGLRSVAINYATQGVGCYINSFLAELEADSNARLQITLGTLFKVRSILIEKKSGTTFKQLATINPNNTLQQGYIDRLLNTGGNTYRVKILLDDGSSIVSEEQTVFYFGKQEYLIIPNPVSAHHPQFRIVSRDLLNGELIIYNGLGQRVLYKTLSSPDETISTLQLKKGLYFLLIRQKGKKDVATKIVVQ